MLIIFCNTIRDYIINQNSPPVHMRGFNFVGRMIFGRRNLFLHWNLLLISAQSNLCSRRYAHYYTDIDRDGHEISRFGGLPRELYFPKGLYFPEVRSTEGKYCPEGKYN